MCEYLKAFFRAVADFFASLAAKYKIYVERENAKARAAAKANAVMMAEQTMLADYPAVADIIAQAANNVANSDSYTLCKVSDLSQICCVPPVVFRRHRITGRVICVWSFRLHRSRAFVQPAEAMRRLLQVEVDAVCATYGFPPLRVHLVFGADFSVGVWVVPLASLIGGANNARP